MLTEFFRCPVVTFTHPVEALAALPALEVGFVVTDYHMPELSGFEFIRKALAIIPGVPFILISGNASQLVEGEFGGEVTPRIIMEKPFSWRKLADEIVLHAPEYGVAST